MRSMVNFFFHVFILLTIIVFSFPATSISSISPVPPRSSSLEKIPDSIISISAGYVLVVDKQYQKLYVFHKNEYFTKVFEAPCSTGKNMGAKQVAGDARTPNGIFFATKVLRNPGPPETYGSLAFTLDFPNIVDRKAGRNGTNIWIHATTKPLAPFQTNGCVVLRESDIHRLIDFIFINRTPIIIQESINWIGQNQIPVAKDELKKILSSWNKAFFEGDLKSLDALYLPGTEIKGKRREQIINNIKVIRHLNNHFIMQSRDISILRHDNNAVILFDQITSVGNDNSYSGLYTKLVLERVNNKWFVIDDLPPEIADEKTLAKLPSTQTASPAANSVTATSPRAPAITPVRGPSVPARSESAGANEEINKLLTKWVNSWKSGDMKSYRSCYTSDFKSKGMNLNDWVAYKADLHKRTKNINIKISNIKIIVSGDNASATFSQAYSSSALKSKGIKKLELRKTDGEWKIYKESML